MDQSEQQTIAKAIGGDVVALENLLLTHYTSLSEHIALRLPPAMQGVVGVEDILQQTFIEAFGDIGQFEPRSDQAFLAWLKALANNRLRDTIKSLKRKKRGGGRQQIHQRGPGEGSSLEDLAQILSGGNSTPSQSLARAEAVQAVQVAIAGLPEDYREVIRLRYLEGMSLEEVAATTERTLGAVKGLINRAKRKMRTAMGRSSLYLSKR